MDTTYTQEERNWEDEDKAILSDLGISREQYVRLHEKGLRRRKVGDEDGEGFEVYMRKADLDRVVRYYQEIMDGMNADNRHLSERLLAYSKGVNGEESVQHVLEEISVAGPAVAERKRRAKASEVVRGPSAGQVAYEARARGVSWAETGVKNAIQNARTYASQRQLPWPPVL
jgi:hypothetical protein